MWNRARHVVEYLIFRMAICLCEILPTDWTVSLADGMAWAVHRLLPRKLNRHSVADGNLARAFPTASPDERDEIILGMWRHFFRMIPELIQSRRKVHMYSYRRVVQFAHFRPTVEAMCSGRRVIMLGGHFGNWEVGMGVFGFWGFPAGIVARELDNPYLHAWFREYREATGHRMMLKKGDFDEMLTLMQRGGHLGLLGDQDAGSRGLFVDFFGVPASTFKSIALLAMEYDALIVVGYSIRAPRRGLDEFWVPFEMGCDALIDPRQITDRDPVRAITEQYTQAIERSIRRAPEQYFWLHRRWKSEPKQRRKAA